MKTKKLLYEGRFVTLTELLNGNLLIKATPEARQEFGRFGKTLKGINEDYALEILLEDIIANSSWNLVPPEAIAALTSAPILSEDVTIEDDGSYTIHGRTWWHERYAVESTIELIFKGGVEFLLAEEWGDDDNS